MVKIRKFSQTDEQPKLIKIFEAIGIKYHKCLEFGAGDGSSYSNTRHFIDQMEFEGVMWDINPRSKSVIKESVTAENINELYEKYGLDKGCDLVSIDVDGNDYWIWKAMIHKPRIVIIEFNGSLPKNDSITIEYNPNFHHDLSNYYGASWLALQKLGKEKGYKLVCNTPLNMIFVLESEVTPNLLMNGEINYDVHRSWPDDTLKRKWIKV